jgi:hypothetical protein
MVFSAGNIEYNNGNLDAMVLSERGRQAHVAKLPMKYFFPLMDMIKNLWYIKQSWPSSWLTMSHVSLICY